MSSTARLAHPEGSAGAHGILCQSKGWNAPRLVACSEEAARADQGNMIKAHEYLDDEEVLEEKICLIVDLLRRAKCCTAYTGAGLSRAAGIEDYASRASNSIAGTGAPRLESNLDAQPTFSHRDRKSVV